MTQVRGRRAQQMIGLCAVMLLLFATPTTAHRVDEYLQATTIELWSNRLRMELRLSPGIAVASRVIDSIDINRDGAISRDEEQRYAQKVLSDQLLTLNSVRLVPRLISTTFPAVLDLRQGLGAIELTFEADVVNRNGQHRLAAENRHRRAISAYLVNALVPQETRLRITAQSRDYQQSAYELLYEQIPAGIPTWLVVAAALLLATAGAGGLIFLRKKRV